MKEMEIKMRKARNVINKKTITVLFLIISSTIVSQKKIVGKYYHADGVGVYSYHYEFLKNGTFIYKDGGDLGFENYGKGHYLIKNDSLILNYNLTELEEESYFRAKKYFNYKDSITITLNVFDFKKRPISNLDIYSFPTYKSIESNKRGIAVLKFKKQKAKEKIKLYIEGEYIARQIIYLDQDANYIIDAYMCKSKIAGFGHLRAYKNQTIIYEILELSEENLKLRTLKNKKITLKRVKN